MGAVIAYSVYEVTFHGDDPINQALLDVMLPHFYDTGLPFMVEGGGGGLADGT